MKLFSILPPFKLSGLYESAMSKNPEDVVAQCRSAITTYNRLVSQPFSKDFTETLKFYSDSSNFDADDTAGGLEIVDMLKRIASQSFQIDNVTDEDIDALGSGKLFVNRFVQRNCGINGAGASQWLSRLDRNTYTELVRSVNSEKLDPLFMALYNIDGKSGNSQPDEKLPPMKPMTQDDKINYRSHGDDSETRYRDGDDYDF